MARKDSVSQGGGGEGSLTTMLTTSFGLIYPPGSLSLEGSDGLEHLRECSDDNADTTAVSIGILGENHVS